MGWWSVEAFAYLFQPFCCLAFDSFKQYAVQVEFQAVFGRILMTSVVNSNEK